MTGALLVPGSFAVADGAPATCGVAAHRGDQTGFTENSLGAMRQAVADRVDYLELDIRPDRDGTLYLMHDRRVDRTTNGTGAIRRMTDAQVRALRLDDGERVPTLARVLAMAKASEVDVLAEMKAMGRKATFRALRRLVRDFGRRRVRVSSFHEPLLDQLRHVAPRVRQAVISRRTLTAKEVRPYDAIMVKYTAITDAWLASMPYPVFAWTPDEPTAWQDFASKVRGVVTNRPVEFKTFRRTGC